MAESYRVVGFGENNTAYVDPIAGFA